MACLTTVAQPPIQVATFVAAAMLSYVHPARPIVEHNSCGAVGHVRTDGLHVGLPHVHGHGLDTVALSGRARGPEGVQALGGALLVQKTRRPPRPRPAPRAPRAPGRGRGRRLRSRERSRGRCGAVRTQRSAPRDSVPHRAAPRRPGRGRPRTGGSSGPGRAPPRAARLARPCGPGARCCLRFPGRTRPRDAAPQAALGNRRARWRARWRPLLRPPACSRRTRCPGGTAPLPRRGRDASCGRTPMSCSGARRRGPVPPRRPGTGSPYPLTLTSQNARARFDPPPDRCARPAACTTASAPRSAARAAVRSRTSPHVHVASRTCSARRTKPRTRCPVCTSPSVTRVPIPPAAPVIVTAIDVTPAPVRASCTQAGSPEVPGPGLRAVLASYPRPATSSAARPAPPASPSLPPACPRSAPRS